MGAVIFAGCIVVFLILSARLADRLPSNWSTAGPFRRPHSEVENPPPSSQQSLARRFQSSKTSPPGWSHLLVQFDHLGANLSDTETPFVSTVRYDRGFRIWRGVNDDGSPTKHDRKYLEARLRELERLSGGQQHD